MADNHNFRIKNGLEVGGVEVITANGLMVLPNTSTASTQDGGTNNTRIATTAFVQQEITSLIGGAPGSLNTLNELAAAINDDASYASTLTTALATKLPLAGGTLTGNLSLGVYSTTATASLLLNGSTANKQSVLKCTDGNLHIDAASGNSVYLNWYGGTGGTFFGNGSAGQKARIDGSGNLTLSGTVDGVDISARDAILTSTTTTANAALPKVGGTMTGTLTVPTIKTPTVGIGVNAYTSAPVSHTSTGYEGLFWHQDSSYGIYRTIGAWTGSYQQLKIKFVTGIELDGGGTSYGKSGVNILGGNLQIDGTTIVDASRNLSNIALTTTDYYRTLANLSSTGDGGLLIYSGKRLGFDESGVRSWTLKANSGNLNVYSGDGNGSFSAGNFLTAGTVTASGGNSTNWNTAYTVANAALPKTGGTITGALTINSSLTVGNTTSSDIYMTDTDEGTRRIHCNSNRIGFLNSANGWGAYCDDAGNWGVAGVVSAAGGNSGQWNTAYTVANAALPKSGGAMTGNISFPAGQNIIRTTHSSGFLEGSYNNVGGNDAKSNPIYTIGSAYNPSDTALGNMYGIGYTNSSFTSMLDGWGLYVAADGDVRIGLCGATGRIKTTGTIEVSGGNSTNWNTAYGWGNHASAGYTNDQTAAEILTAIKTVDSSGSGLDADLLDGQQGSYYQPASTAITTANIGSQSVSSASNIDGRAFVNTGSNSATNADTIDSNGISYYTSGVTNFSGNATDGALYSQQYSTTWQHQIAGDYRSGQIAVRGKNSGNWQPWNKVWTAGNDGSGSGLDADLLDGVSSNSFLRSDTVDSFTGTSLQFPTLGLSINTNNGAATTHYIRGTSTHIVFGTVDGNAYYQNYGNTTGAYNLSGVVTHNGSLVGSKIWGISNDGSGSGLDADLLDGQQGSYYYAASNPSGYTSNVGDITGVTAGTGLTGGGTSGTPTLNVIGGSGITANANDIAVDSTVLTTSTYGTTLTPVYAPVKKGTATLTNSYQTVCTVNGSSLGSSVRMTIAGTGASTVISTILDIVCNHSLDILVTSQTGTYTILTVKIVSNNNEDFAVQLKTNSTNNLPVNMEVFALNSETVAFTSTNPYTGATLEHECKSGGFASSSSGGSAHEFYSNGTKLIAANDNQSLHDTNALSISGSTITLRKGDNTTETIAIPAQGDITGVTAGNGLTGGATSGAATVNVGAGDGISVTANTVTVNSTVVRTTGAQTITGLKTFTDNGGIKYSGISSTPLWLNRSSGTNVNIRLSSSSGTTYVGQGASSGILEIGTTADLIGPGQRVFADNYHPNADKWTTARSHTVTLTGAVTGTVSQSVDGTAAKTWTIATTATADPTLTLAGDVTGSATFTNLGNATLTATVANNSHTHIQANITDSYRLFNNMGQNHSTTTDFNSISNFGVRYVQGNTNGPGTGSTQFYGVTLGLGNEHAISTYAMQLAIPRYLATDKYVSFRTREGGTWQSWTKIAAGTADTWKTARTLTTTLTGDVTGTASMSVNGGSNQTVTINTVVANNSHTHSYLPLAGGTLTGTLNSTTGNYTSTTAANSFTTAHGYIQLGPMNTSWAHIYTDRPGFYLNKEMRVNNNLVWNSGNDGSGSGLDADLLDGIQGSSFLRSDATDTASGAVTFSAATIYMAGDLAHSGDTNTYMGFHAADQWRVVTGGVERLEVNNTAVTVSGNFTATGNITAYSDIRLKEDIKPIEDAVSKVQQLTGNTYTRNDLKDPERRYGGVIAQEVEVVLPEAVNDSEDGTKTVDYNAMIALLIESIKELKAEVDDLKTQLENK